MEVPSTHGHLHRQAPASKPLRVEVSARGRAPGLRREDEEAGRTETGAAAGAEPLGPQDTAPQLAAGSLQRKGQTEESRTEPTRSLHWAVLAAARRTGPALYGSSASPCENPRSLQRAGGGGHILRKPSRPASASSQQMVASAEPIPRAPTFSHATWPWTW